MPRVLLRPALVVCPDDNMEVVRVDSSNEPHQGVVLDSRRLGVVDTGLLGEGLRRLCHGGPDRFEAEVWLAMECVRLLALVVDDAVLLRLDAALGARLVLVREDRPADAVSLSLPSGRGIGSTVNLHASAVALVVGNHDESSEACVHQLAEFIHLLYAT